tara:strand:- start:53 stop:646 length:594 start_codon:yes stop_codon:yes gene_type:complete
MVRELSDGEWMSLSSPSMIAAAVVGLVAFIVLYDGWRVMQGRSRVDRLGRLSGGGFAWQTDAGRELVRNGSQLATLGVMMALPWMLSERSETPIWWLLLFDGLLALHCVWLVLPKRYAITRTHLFVDGFEHAWESLRWGGWEGGSRIVLQRRGWWLFAPLPLGGQPDDLVEVAARLEALFDDDWDEFCAELGLDEAE